MLLEAGAKPHHTNSVKRTAAAMAAFVGNHNCVAVINNFVPKENLSLFTRLTPYLNLIYKSRKESSILK